MIYKGPGIVKNIKTELFHFKNNLKNITNAIELILDRSYYNNYIAKGIFMSKRCELPGISPLKGHNVSHAKNKTKRRFLPNLKKVTFRSDILKKNIKLNVTNAALRSVDFKGGLDKFLKSAKSANLSKKVKKIKASVSAKI